MRFKSSPIRLVISCPYVFAVSAVVEITATPEAILALAIFADAPLDDVIVVGCGLIPVASSKKSIVVKISKLLVKKKLLKCIY